jgi:hypothetical protein
VAARASEVPSRGSSAPTRSRRSSFQVALAPPWPRAATGTGPLATTRRSGVVRITSLDHDPTSGGHLARSPRARPDASRAPAAIAPPRPGAWAAPCAVHLRLIPPLPATSAPRPRPTRSRAASSSGASATTRRPSGSRIALDGDDRAPIGTRTGRAAATTGLTGARKDLVGHDPTHYRHPHRPRRPRPDPFPASIRAARPRTHLHRGFLELSRRSDGCSMQPERIPCQKPPSTGRPR